MRDDIVTLENMKDSAFNFCKQLESLSEATLVLLSGDLGAGKTTFVQFCAEYFGITETITSPTFVIQKEYTILQNPYFKKFVHIDAYRLENIAQLEYLGWATLQQDSSCVVFLEWPEHIPEIFAQQTHHISLEIKDDGTRSLDIE